MFSKDFNCNVNIGGKGGVSGTCTMYSYPDPPNKRVPITGGRIAANTAWGDSACVGTGFFQVTGAIPGSAITTEVRFPIRGSLFHGDGDALDSWTGSTIWKQTPGGPGDFIDFTGIRQ